MRLSAAWLVLTFGTELAENPDWKSAAGKRMRNFVDWLRKKKGMPDLQYAATYELQERGRLHINLVAGPWKEVPHAELLKRWGARVSVAWVKDEESIGRETAKSYSPESLGNYLAKLKQSVPVEWGRRVSFSQKWPNLPRVARRKGSITWTQEWEMKPVQLARFEFAKERGWWQEVRIGEWASGAPACDCFDLVAVEDG